VEGRFTTREANVLQSVALPLTQGSDGFCQGEASSVLRLDPSAVATFEVAGIREDHLASPQGRASTGLEGPCVGQGVETDVIQSGHVGTHTYHIQGET